MKKILTLVLTLTLMSGCSLFRKKSAGSGGVSTETTASGGSESIDTSPMNFSPQGSDSGTIEGLNTVFFDYDSAALSSAERAKLEANIRWILANPNVSVTVEGHCDHRGSTEYNLSLGERRANAVKRLLTNAGVPSARINTVSYGKEKPLVDSDSESAMARNRRANFVPN